MAQVTAREWYPGVGGKEGGGVEDVVLISGGGGSLRDGLWFRTRPLGEQLDSTVNPLKEWR